jgi:hypothetical protein
MAWHAWATPFRSCTSTNAALQVLDLALLRADPCGAIWRLHSQPPLWNVWVAVMLRIGPLCEIVLSLAVGVVPVVLLARRFATTPWAAAVMSVALLSPDIYGAWAGGTYDWPALWLAAVFCWQLLDGRMVAAGSVGVAMVLLRSHFHPAILFSSLLAVWVVTRGWRVDSWRRVVALSVIAVLAWAWPVKNFLMFGHLTHSSWGGYTFSRGTPWNPAWWTYFLRHPDLRAAAVRDHSDGHPATASDLKPDGSLNWNHVVMFELEPLAVHGWEWKRTHLREYGQNCLYYLSVALCRPATVRAPTPYSRLYDPLFPRWPEAEAWLVPAQRRLEGWMSAHSCCPIVSVRALAWVALMLLATRSVRTWPHVVFAVGMLAAACLTDGVEAYRTCLPARWAALLAIADWAQRAAVVRRMG